MDSEGLQRNFNDGTLPIKGLISQGTIILPVFPKMNVVDFIKTGLSVMITNITALSNVSFNKHFYKAGALSVPVLDKKKKKKKKKKKLRRNVQEQTL